LAQVSPARKIAFETLLQVDAGQAFASDLLQGRKVSGLSERDRALATEIVMGVLRWRGEIDYRLQQLSGKSAQSLDSEVLAALRMGVYQIAFLEKIPKSAAVNESVELTKLSRKRSASGLVNAVLRKCEPEKPARQMSSALPDAPALLAGVRRTVPAWMLERWEAHFSVEAGNRLAWAATQVPATTLRISTSTPEPDNVIQRLAEMGCSVSPGKCASNALIAEADEGAVSRLAEELGLAIQDEASQLIPELVGVAPGQRVLDLCAAPGMKTSLLADAVGGGLIVACDSSARRLKTLQKLLPRLTANASAVRAVRLDATQPLPFGQGFDRILVDAPCSGTGTLSRNPEIKWRLTKDDLARLPMIQSQILSNALSALAPGGWLVYATCSLEPEENEQVVESVLAANTGCRLLGREELAGELPKIAPLIDERGYFHTRPDLDGMDGFFAAVITQK
jgi:16S rRNA (cytosine967-C5)-methyltransferase